MIMTRYYYTQAKMITGEDIVLAVHEEARHHFDVLSTYFDLVSEGKLDQVKYVYGVTSATELMDADLITTDFRAK
jgi:hypothetical protein